MDTWTDGHTDRVTTVGTLSGFQDFFLKPIIKDRPNMIIIFQFTRYLWNLIKDSRYYVESNLKRDIRKSQKLKSLDSSSSRSIHDVNICALINFVGFTSLINICSSESTYISISNTINTFVGSMR